MLYLFLTHIFVAVFGLVIGSFLNMVIYRLEKEEGFDGRSYCPHCKHTLNWKDLIPVLSFFTLKRKCRYCNRKISWQYPIVEISTALIFLLIFSFSAEGGSSFGRQLTIFNFVNLLFSSYIVSSLIIIFVYDLKHYIIPDKVLFPAIGVASFYNLILDYKFLFTNLVFAAIIASLFFLLIFLVSKGAWIGFGDVKLAILLGLFLGFPNILVALFLAFLFGAIIGLLLIIFSKKGLKSEVPFAPFLICGTFLALLFGQEIINWYTSLLISI